MSVGAARRERHDDSHRLGARPGGAACAKPSGAKTPRARANSAVRKLLMHGACLRRVGASKGARPNRSVGRSDADCFDTVSKPSSPLRRRASAGNSQAMQRRPKTRVRTLPYRLHDAATRNSSGPHHAVQKEGPALFATTLATLIATIPAQAWAQGSAGAADAARRDHRLVDQARSTPRRRCRCRCITREQIQTQRRDQRRAAAADDQRGLELGRTDRGVGLGRRRPAASRSYRCAA